MATGTVTPQFPMDVELKLKIRVEDASDYEYITSTDPALSIATEISDILDIKILEVNGVKFTP